MENQPRWSSQCTIRLRHLAHARCYRTLSNIDHLHVARLGTRIRIMTGLYPEIMIRT